MFTLSSSSKIFEIIVDDIILSSLISHGSGNVELEEIAILLQNDRNIEVPFSDLIWFSKTFSRLVGIEICLNVTVIRFLKLDSTAAEIDISSPLVKNRNHNTRP